MKVILAAFAAVFILAGCGQKPENAQSRIAKACARNVERKGLPSSSYDSCLQITRGMLEQGITEKQILNRLDGKVD
jgi:protein involved in sex pheromone biosynthesis